MKRAKHNPGGTIYLIVMATVVVVVTLGVTGLALVRVQRKAAEMTVDLVDARAAALTAVDFGAALMELSPTWRTQAAAGNGVLASTPLGRGTIEVKLTDPVDGDLTNSASDAVDVTGTGKVGMAVQAWGARLTPTYLPVSALGTGITVGANIGVTSGVVVGSGVMASNANITASSAAVRVAAQATGTVSGGTFSIGTSSGTVARQLPDATAITYFQSIGAKITSVAMSGRRIEDVILSPTNNPYGSATNANGVYWLDCNGEDYTIRNCRIVGTLVLLNCTGNTVISGSVNWEPVVAGMPALIVQGAITFQGSMAPLSEATTGINFNPASMPYYGVSNSKLTDVYPSQIKGLVYVSGNTFVTGEAQIDGVLVVGGRAVISGTLSVLYDDTYYYAPPVGFRSATVMTLVPGSFAQQVN